MSFVLEYRKRLLAKQEEEARLRRASAGYVSMPLDEGADTRGNRARVFAALVVAGLLLAVFNSGGLVQYAYGLTDTLLGRKLVVVAEKWHALMQTQHANSVVEEIRDTVTFARQTSWGDLTTVFRATPAAMPGEPAAPKVVPAKSVPEPAPQAPAIRKAPPPAFEPAGPVMRASADGLASSSR